MALPTMPSNITSASITLYALLQIVTFVTGMKFDLLDSYLIDI